MNESFGENKQRRATDATKGCVCQDIHFTQQAMLSRDRLQVSETVDIKETKWCKVNVQSTNYFSNQCNHTKGSKPVKEQFQETKLQWQYFTLRQ